MKLEKPTHSVQVLAYVNQMFQQISGINLITYYAATIYEDNIHLDSFTSRILAAGNGTGRLALFENIYESCDANS